MRKPSQPHEQDRIINVVIRQPVHLGSFGQQVLSFLEGHPNRQGIRFG